LAETEVAGITPEPILIERAIQIAAASLDPLGAAATSVIPAGTPMAPVPASGKYKPIRRALCTAGCTTGEKVIAMTDNTMFAVGDVVGVVAAATPLLAAAVAIGTIASKIAATSITLVANAASAVTSGDQIEVMENVTVLTMGDAVILKEAVDLRGADGVAVDTGSVGVKAGSIAKAQLNYNVSLGITGTRLAAELPLMDLRNTVAGVVT
jgi:hypothetical protein